MLLRSTLVAVGLALCGALISYAETPQETPQVQDRSVRGTPEQNSAPQTSVYPFRVIILYHQPTTTQDTVAKMVDGANLTIKTKSSPRMSASRTAPASGNNTAWQSIPIEEFLRGVFGSQPQPAVSEAPSEQTGDKRAIEKRDIRRTPQVRTLGDLFRQSPMQNVAGFTATSINAKEGQGGGGSGCTFPCFRLWIFCVCIYPDPDPLLDLLKDLIGLRTTTPTIVIAVNLTPENANSARMALKRALETNVWGDQGCIPVPFN